MNAAELAKPQLQNKTGKSRLKWLPVVLLVGVAVAGTAVVWALRHAEPILQARIIETLSARFQSRVELSTFHVSIAPGLRVWGGVVSRTRSLERDAVLEMKEGPSKPVCRNRLQTAMSCYGQKPRW